jgi:hypothetical protein
VPDRLFSVSRPGVTAVGAAVGSTTVGALPVFLIGGLSVQIAADLRLPEGAIGPVVAAFWATNAMKTTGVPNEGLAGPSALCYCGQPAGAPPVGWCGLLAPLEGLCNSSPGPGRALPPPI